MDFITPLPTRGVGFPIEGLDPHTRHQRADVFAPGLETLRAQQIAQHPCAGERMLAGLPASPNT